MRIPFKELPSSPLTAIMTNKNSLYSWLNLEPDVLSYKRYKLFKNTRIELSADKVMSGYDRNRKCM